MLSGNELWNSTLEKFIIQDVNSAIPSFLGKVMKTVTNIAHRIDYAVWEVKKKQVKELQINN